MKQPMIALAIGCSIGSAPAGAHTGESGDTPLILGAPVVVRDANEDFASHDSRNHCDELICCEGFAVVGKIDFKHDV